MAGSIIHARHRRHGFGLEKSSGAAFNRAKASMKLVSPNHSGQSGHSEVASADRFPLVRRQVVDALRGMDGRWKVFADWGVLVFAFLAFARTGNSPTWSALWSQRTKPGVGFCLFP
jgi:hypothetical protein